MELLKHISYEQLTEYNTFYHLKSRYPDEWYNFIVPKVVPEELEWSLALLVVEKEKLRDFRVSFYVDADAVEPYRRPLTQHGFSPMAIDDYMFFQMHKPLDVNTKDVDIVEVDDETLTQKHIDISKACFIEWPNNEEYSRRIIDVAMNNRNADVVLSNVIVNRKGESAAVGNMLGSKSLNLAYLHAMGTLPEFRRLGMFELLVKHLSNVAWAQGITEIFSLMDTNAGSYRGFKKLGLKNKMSYQIFVKR